MRKIYTSVVIAHILINFAYSAPFSVQDGVFDQSATNLGLGKILPSASSEGAVTVTVFTPTASSDHYGNGVVMAGFKGKLFCQWQSSATNEDSEDTWVAYSIGEIANVDGSRKESWSTPKALMESPSNGMVTSGGWQVLKNADSTKDTLIAFINVWPDSLNSSVNSSASGKAGFAYYRESADGITWGALKPVLMKDGTQMKGIIEQDPHEYDNRLYNAAHFQPGLLAGPIYTDDLSGRTGWVRAKYTNLEHSGTSSREMEPSIFKNSDGEIVMTFRDQNSSYMRLASVSTDRGETWSEAVLTNMPDSRAKQSAGNLPDGSAYLVGNPVTNSTRIPLSITLSSDGKVFDKAYNLRTQDEIPTLVYTGTAKRQGYHYPKSTRIGDYLYVSYATNKELMEYTRIPLSAISTYTPANEDSSGISQDTQDSTKTPTDAILKNNDLSKVSRENRRTFDVNGRECKGRKNYILLRIH